MVEVNFKLLSLNARGIRDFQKSKSIFTWIQKQKADLIFLPETYSTPDIVNNWKFQWGGEMIYSHGTSHSRGVLVLISDQLQCELKSVTCDENGRFILIEALIQESPYILLNLYAPTKQNEQWAFYEKISTSLDEMIVDPQSQIIIGGDFNVQRDADLDNSGGKIETKNSG